MESLWVLALGNCSGCTLMKLVWNRRKGEFSHRNLFTYLLKTDENLDNEGTKTITPLLPIALAIKSRAFSFSYRVLHDVVLPLSPTHVIPCLTTLPSLWPPSVPQVLKILSARVSCMCCSFRMLCSWLCPWTCSFSFFRSQIRSLSRETFTNHCLQLLYIVFIVLIKFVIYYLSVFISPHNRRDLVLWQPASSWVPSLAPWGICVWITVSLGTTEKTVKEITDCGLWFRWETQVEKDSPWYTISFFFYECITPWPILEWGITGEFNHSDLNSGSRPIELELRGGE